MPRWPQVSVGERFWAKVAMASPDECWFFTGAKNDDNYGMLRIGSDRVYAHRLAWVFTYGALEPGLIIRHMCDVHYPPGNVRYRLCCNPTHLEKGTDTDNMHDSYTTGRRLPTRGPRASHAKRWGGPARQLSVP